MKILIYATAAEMGGAITILNQYYEKAKQSNDDYIFILSKPKLEDTKNIKTFNYEYIKKNWLLRIYFYWFKLPNIVKEINPDRIISLNNTMIKRVGYPQAIYLHQSLPFFDIKFNILTESYLWVVKNLIGRLIKYSLKRVDSIIVQSHWLKRKVVKQLNISSEKISVEVPKIEYNLAADFKDDMNQKSKKVQFIYPAGYVKYKNHQMIIEALKKLNSTELEKIEVKFTLSKDVNKHVKKLYKQVELLNLPIKFVNYLSKEELYFIYQSHILLFPSEIETFGLPLLEARMAKAKVFSLKTDFSIEIMESYSKNFFLKNAYELMELIKSEIQR